MSTVLETPQLTKSGHSHASNFGRYVAGCPKCIEKYPDGPEKRARKMRAPKVVMQEKVEAMKSDLRAEILAELTAKMADAAPVVAAVQAETLQASTGTGISEDQLIRAMTALGTELRRGDPEVERQREEAKNRVQRAKEAERTLVMERLAMIKFEQDSCSHKMENGLSRVRGQEHADGLLHEFCTWCQKPFPPRQISAQERAARMA